MQLKVLDRISSCVIMRSMDKLEKRFKTVVLVIYSPHGSAWPIFIAGVII